MHNPVPRNPGNRVSSALLLLHQVLHLAGNGSEAYYSGSEERTVAEKIEDYIFDRVTKAAEIVDTTHGYIIILGL